MKKILYFILLTALATFFSIKINASELPNKIVIHYYRYDDNYEDFNFWLWPNLPQAGEGIQHNFITEQKDEYGVYLEVDLNKHYPNYENMTRIGIIIKKGGWDGYREPGGDRFIDLLKAETVSGVAHAYFVEGEVKIGISSTDLANNIPDYRDKILRSYFDQNNRIITASTQIPLLLEVYESKLLIKTITPTSKTVAVEIANINLEKTYTVKATFINDVISEKNVSLEQLYDTKAFEENFTYEGNLGVTFTENETIFRLWAPLSKSVVLNLYNQGHPLYDNNGAEKREENPIESHLLTKIENGAWEIVLNQNVKGLYYTFTVENDIETHEITDPYAYSTGADGLRGLIVDFKDINPLGWEYNKRPDTIKNLTDYIVYELHVRDLTSDETWNGNANYRGKFLGLTETNTTYTKDGITVKTGLDHIEELGVNAVQLLPIFDFGYVSEVEAYSNKAYEKIFNWGYMPMHFNTLEGSYSLNPFDGNLRIKEFKEVVMAFYEKDLRIIMDVVYNHTGESETSNFHKILPGYYHRLNNEGGFSNGSGTGNETASNRSMMRKFMVDSVLFWATEYNLSGFRFDLMALHDIETMNLIKEKLYEIDETIIVYGEPWMGGTSPIDPNQSANQKNLKKLNHVGAFNDYTRDAIKGSVWTNTEGGFVQGNVNNYDGVKYGIVGGINYPNISGANVYVNSPDQTINYVSAHDNHTLYDKLRLTKVNLSFIEEMQIQANAIILTSQGIPFIHAGAELMRSKPTDSGYDGNSYESPDSVNKIRWDNKIKHLKVFNYYKDLITIRKTYKHFRLTTNEEILSSLEFLETSSANQAIAYKISLANYPEIIVIHSSNPKSGLTTVDLDPNKTYRLLTGPDKALLDEYELVEGIGFAFAHQTVILVEQFYTTVSPNSLFKDEVVQTNIGDNYKILSNLLVIPSYFYTSSYYDLNKVGRYTITIKIDDNGKHVILMSTIMKLLH